MNYELLKEIYKKRTQIRCWIDSLPKEIGYIFFENPAIDGECFITDLLIKELYKDKAEDVFWLLYDWKSGDVFEYEGTVFVLNTIEEAMYSIFEPVKLASKS